MPSYSMSVKQNMISSLEMRRGRIKTVVLGMSQAMARLHSEEGEEKILFTSENIRLIKLIRLYLEREAGLASQLSYNKSRGSRGKKRLSLILHQVEGFCDFLGLSCQGGELSLEIPGEVFKNSRTMKDYVIGFFLASGFIAHPQKGYHLEFVCRTEAQAGSLVELLDGLSFHFKTVKRLNSTIVYVKDSELIADMLSAMDATTIRLAFEDEKIVKQINNKVNRLVNCDTANIEKSSEAAIRQKNAIQYIEATIGLYQLDEKLRTAAQLRLDHPILSLRELGQMMKPALGKSGMNHRMNRLEEIASELKKREGRATSED